MKIIRLLFVNVMLFTFSNCFAQTSNKPVLNHIAVHVNDLAKSTAFYQQIVGIDTIPEPFHDGKHTWLSLGNGSNLHLISGAALPTDHDKFNHICFSVPSLQAFIVKLQSNHIAFENWVGEKSGITLRVDAVQQIYFKDPDGYWIEVNDAKK
jgi:lactoylglutathione lyase